MLNDTHFLATFCWHDRRLIKEVFNRRMESIEKAKKASSLNQLKNP